LTGGLFAKADFETKAEAGCESLRFAGLG